MLRNLIYGGGIDNATQSSSQGQLSQMGYSQDAQNTQRTYYNNTEDEKQHKSIERIVLGPVISNVPKLSNKRLANSMPSLENIEVKHKRQAGICSEQHPQFIHHYPQEEPLSVTYNNITRNLWKEACFGGDIEAAIKILKVLLLTDSIEYNDFNVFINMLCKYSPNLNISTIANLTVQYKLKTIRSDTAKALISLFMEIYISDNNIIYASEFLNKYSYHPSCVRDPVILSMTAIMNCIKAIHYTYAITQHTLPKHSITSKYLERFMIGSCSPPTHHDISYNPVLFRHTVTLLNNALDNKQYRHFRNNISRLLKDLEYSLSVSVSYGANDHIMDMHVLYASLLNATDRNREAHEVMKNLISRNPNSGRARRLYVAFAFNYLTLPRSELAEIISNWVKIDKDAKSLGVSSCMILYKLKLMSKRAFINALCDNIENLSESQKCGTIAWIYWRALATLLGPLDEPCEQIKPFSEVAIKLQSACYPSCVAEQSAPATNVANTLSEFQQRRSWWRSGHSSVFLSCQMIGPYSVLTPECLGLALLSESSSLNTEDIYRMISIDGYWDITSDTYVKILTIENDLLCDKYISYYNKLKNNSFILQINQIKKQNNNNDNKNNNNFSEYMKQSLNTSFAIDELDSDMYSSGDEDRNDNENNNKDNNSDGEYEVESIYSNVSDIANVTMTSVSVDGSYIKEERNGTSSCTSSPLSSALHSECPLSTTMDENQDNSQDRSNKTLWDELCRICSFTDSSSDGFLQHHIPKQDFSMNKARSATHGIPFKPNIMKSITKLTNAIVNKIDEEIYLRLGHDALELLTYQIIARCHLTNDQDNLFCTRACQIIIQNAIHNRDNESVYRCCLRCIAYLRSMGFDITRALRSAINLGLNEVSLSRQQTIQVEVQSNWLVSSNGTCEYEPF